MRKITILAALVAASAAGVAAPIAAHAQYYGSYLTQPPCYAPRAYAPPAVTAQPAYSPPRVVVTPPRYNSGAYWDYRHFGDPTTRDSLDTCAYC